MAADALIVFDQGGPGTPGEAFEGTTGVLVTVTNDDNTDVTEWTIELLDTPTTSALVPGVLGTAVNNTPTASFTPDVPGSYRVRLVVEDGVNSIPDIRNFGIRNSRGIIIPPYQKSPDPLSLTAKPDEQNYGGQTRGWAGSFLGGQLDQFLRTYEDIPLQVVTAASLTLDAETSHLVIVDLDSVGSDSAITLPAGARPGRVMHVGASGVTPGRVVTVDASGGDIAPSGTVDIPLGGIGTFVHQAGNLWWPLGRKTDFYERTLVGSIAETDQILGYKVVGSAYIGLASFVNVKSITFEAIIETSDGADAVEVRLFNATTAAAVAGTTQQSVSLVADVITADVTAAIPEGPNLYEVHLRLVTTGAPNVATCSGARLIIEWEQV